MAALLGACQFFSRHDPVDFFAVQDLEFKQGFGKVGKFFLVLFQQFPCGLVHALNKGVDGVVDFLRHHLGHFLGLGNFPT